MISNVSVYLCIVNKIIHARTNYRANIQISSFTVAEIEIAVPLANIRLKGDLHAPKGGAASAMTADNAGHRFVSSTQYIGHRITCSVHTRYYLVTRSNLYLARPFFLSFPVSFLPSVRRDPPSSVLSPLPPPDSSACVVRAGALIMRGFRRSRFHSFLRLRHREMIIGT